MDADQKVMTDELVTKADKEVLKTTPKPKEEEWLEEEEMASVKKSLDSDNESLMRMVKKNPTETREKEKKRRRQ